MQKLIRIMAALTLLGACSTTKNLTAEAMVGLSAEQKATLTNWLSKNDTLRPTTDEDCDCKDGIDEIRRNGFFGKPVRNYHPYLQVGDFNHDTYSDFAIILVSKRDPRRYRLAIFNGGAGHRPGEAAFVMDANPPAALFYNHEDALHIGAFFSDNLCALKPIGSTYKFDCESSSED